MLFFIATIVFAMRPRRGATVSTLAGDQIELPADPSGSTILQRAWTCIEAKRFLSALWNHPEGFITLTSPTTNLRLAPQTAVQEGALVTKLTLNFDEQRDIRIIEFLGKTSNDVKALRAVAKKNKLSTEEEFPFIPAVQSVFAGEHVWRKVSQRMYESMMVKCILAAMLQPLMMYRQRELYRNILFSRNMLPVLTIGILCDSAMSSVQSYRPSNFSYLLIMILKGPYHILRDKLPWRYFLVTYPITIFLPSTISFAFGLYKMQQMMPQMFGIRERFGWRNLLRVHQQQINYISRTKHVSRLRAVRMLMEETLP